MDRRDALVIVGAAVRRRTCPCSPGRARSRSGPACAEGRVCCRHGSTCAAGAHRAGPDDRWDRRSLATLAPDWHPGDMDRPALADLLRTPPRAAGPADVGLPPGVAATHAGPAPRRGRRARCDLDRLLHPARAAARAASLRGGAGLAGARLAAHRRRARPPVPPGRAGRRRRGTLPARTSARACSICSTGSSTPGFRRRRPRRRRHAERDVGSRLRRSHPSPGANARRLALVRVSADRGTFPERGLGEPFAHACRGPARDVRPPGRRP